MPKKIVVPTTAELQEFADSSPRAYQAMQQAEVYEFLEEVAQKEVNKGVTNRNKKVTAAL